MLFRELCTIFQLTDGKDPEKTEVLLDLYYYAIMFSRESKFSKAQTSAFISIIKATHDVCTETPFGNVNETFTYFKDLILCHSVKVCICDFIYCFYYFRLCLSLSYQQREIYCILDLFFFALSTRDHLLV